MEVFQRVLQAADSEYILNEETYKKNSWKISGRRVLESPQRSPDIQSSQSLKKSKMLGLIASGQYESLIQKTGVDSLQNVLQLYTSQTVRKHSKTQVQHQKLCRRQTEEREQDCYDMLHIKRSRQRNDHNHQHNNNLTPFDSEDYYPSLKNRPVKNTQPEKQNCNTKRPVSAMNRQIQQKRISQKKVVDVNKVKKTASYSKFKDQKKGKAGASQGRQDNMISSAVYSQKNGGTSKNQTMYIQPTNTKLKKKNMINQARPLRIQVQRPVNNGPTIKKKPSEEVLNRVYGFRPDQPFLPTRPKRSIRQQQHSDDRRQKSREKREKRFVEQDEDYQIPLHSHIQQRRQQQVKPERKREQVQQLPRQQEIIRGNQRQQLRSNRRQEQSNRQAPREAPRQIRINRDQYIIPQNFNREVPRQAPRQARNNNREQQSRGQQRQGINRGRNNNRRRATNNRANQRNFRGQGMGENLLNFVQQTIHEQMQLMNNQFSMVSNIFQHLPNFININIDSHPHNYDFSVHTFQSSSEYSDSDDYSSSEDYYFEAEDEQQQGLQQQELDSIQNKPYRTSLYGANQCTICLAQLIDNETVKQLSCDHIFHSECIDQWLKRKSACPVCRDKLGRVHHDH